MFQNDYIMRLAQQFGDGLAAMLGLKKKGKASEAMHLSGDLLKQLIGLDPKLIQALSEHDLIRLLQTGDEDPWEKMIILAQMMEQQADLHAMMGDPAMQDRYLIKALNLSLLAWNDYGAKHWPGTVEQIERLRASLGSADLPYLTHTLLWPYFTAAAQYASAEDVLYRMLDANALQPARNAPLLDEAAAWYNRLLLLDDDQLAAGNLPRDEVLDGLQDVQTRQASAAASANDHD